MQFYPNPDFDRDPSGERCCVPCVSCVPCGPCAPSDPYSPSSPCAPVDTCVSHESDAVWSGTRMVSGLAALLLFAVALAAQWTGVDGHRVVATAAAAVAFAFAAADTKSSATAMPVLVGVAALGSVDLVGVAITAGILTIVRGAEHVSVAIGVCLYFATARSTEDMSTSRAVVVWACLCVAFALWACEQRRALAVVLRVLTTVVAVSIAATS